MWTQQAWKNVLPVESERPTEARAEKLTQIKLQSVIIVLLIGQHYIYVIFVTSIAWLFLSECCYKSEKMPNRLLVIRHRHNVNRTASARPPRAWSELAGFHGSETRWMCFKSNGGRELLFYWHNHVFELLKLILVIMANLQRQRHKVNSLSTQFKWTLFISLNLI